MIDKDYVCEDEGFPAFLPGSQLDIGQVRNMDEYIGNEYDIKLSSDRGLQ